MANRPDDLRGSDLDAASVDGVVSARAAFDALVRRYTSTINWYLDEKKGKARASKRLRIIAILLGVVGGVAPIISVLSGVINSYLGYALLALAAGVQVSDKYFGFSSSWIRYVSAAMNLQGKCLDLQMEWHSRVASDGDDSALWEILKGYSSELTIIVSAETRTWSDEFSNGMGALDVVEGLVRQPHCVILVGVS